MCAGGRRDTLNFFGHHPFKYLFSYTLCFLSHAVTQKPRTRMGIGQTDTPMSGRNNLTSPLNALKKMIQFTCCAMCGGRRGVMGIHALHPRLYLTKRSSSNVVQHLLRNVPGRESRICIVRQSGVLLATLATSRERPRRLQWL